AGRGTGRRAELFRVAVGVEIQGDVRRGLGRHSSGYVNRKSFAVSVPEKFCNRMVMTLPFESVTWVSRSLPCRVKLSDDHVTPRARRSILSDPWLKSSTVCVVPAAEAVTANRSAPLPPR